MHAGLGKHTVSWHGVLAFLSLATAMCAAVVREASAELVQKDQVRISLRASLSPTTLPRHGSSPIKVSIGGRIFSTSRTDVPQLQEVIFAFNKAGKLDLGGLPRCRLGRIRPSTTLEALSACGSSLVGEGHFSANVRFPEQSPFPSEGKVLAFNGTLRGSAVIFAHIYGTEPVPTSYVLPLRIEHSRGTFGTTLAASLPDATGEWGYVTGLELKLGRAYSSHGRRRGFLSAGCPAPGDFPGAVFPLLKSTFAFAGGRTLTATLNRSCKVRG